MKIDTHASNTVTAIFNPRMPTVHHMKPHDTKIIETAAIFTRREIARC